MKAFILAGGFATRLWPLTEKRAKPLLPLAGKPILSHIVEKIPADIPVTVSTNAVFAEGFSDWKESMHRDNIEIIIEDTKKDDHKLGALGATAQWIEENNIDDDVLLLTGDNYFGFSIEEFLQKASPDTPLLAAHDIGDIAKASSFGTVILADDGKTITAFEEKPKDPKTTLVSTGCSVLPRNTIAVLTEYAKQHPDNVGGIFEEFLRRGITVDCFTFSEAWFDIGAFDAYLNATRMLVGDNVIKEEGAVLENTQTHGSVVVGAGSEVQGSQLQDVVLFEGCSVTDCVLENCILDNGCQLHGVDLTGKMLREKTTLKP